MGRIRYFDLVRVICFIAIIYYHMVAQLPINGICTSEDIWPFVANPNMQLGTFAVSVFFMISGASLMYTSKEKFLLGNYYLKRYIRLLIPFYVVTFLYFIFQAVRVRDIAGVYVGGIPVWRWVLTILGMDEWVNMLGITTFSRGIGEWFLGVLVILSVLFPILRYFLLKWEKAFMAVVIMLYLYVIYNYNSVVPFHMSLTVKSFDFILGMWFGLYCDRMSSKWKYISIPIVLLYMFSPMSFPINEALKIVILAFAFLVSFSFLEEKLQKIDMKWIKWLSKYSYELFLVHHLVIYAVTPYQPPFINDIWDILILFGVETVIIFVVAIVAKYISDRCIQCIWKVIRKE